MESSRLIRSVITALVVASAVAAFFMLRGLVGPNAAVISVLPVAVVAAYFGTKWGLLATSVAFPANVFLLDRGSEDLVSPFISLSLLLIAWIFGQLHKLDKHQREETAQRMEQLRGLETAAQRTHELLDAVPDTVMRITDAGRIMELHGEQHLGLDARREDILFRSVAAISENWQDHLLELARTAKTAGSARAARHRIEIDGHTRVIESRVAPIPGGDTIVVSRLVEGASIGPV